MAGISGQIPSYRRDRDDDRWDRWDRRDRWDKGPWGKGPWGKGPWDKWGKGKPWPPRRFPRRHPRHPYWRPTPGGGYAKQYPPGQAGIPYAWYPGYGLVQ